MVFGSLFGWYFEVVLRLRLHKMRKRGAGCMVQYKQVLYREAKIAYLLTINYTYPKIILMNRLINEMYITCNYLFYKSCYSNLSTTSKSAVLT